MMEYPLVERVYSQCEVESPEATGTCLRWSALSVLEYDPLDGGLFNDREFAAGIFAWAQKSPQSERLRADKK